MEEKKYRYQGIGLDLAVDIIRENLHYKKEQRTEEAELTEALGRVCVHDMISPIDQPPFDRSPLDGYALRAQDTKRASLEAPVRLSVLEEVTAGDFPQKRIGEGQAVRIMTGAPIPSGADSIIRQEDTDYGETSVLIRREMSAYENYCYAGEDFKKGDCLIPANTLLMSTEIGILASMGYTKVLVYQKPKVALLTTGDELMKPGAPLLPGKIYNSNLYILMSRLKELGVEPFLADVLSDDITAVAGQIKKASEQADLVITTGGVSVGRKDIMHGVFDALEAEKIFWRILIKPGTPTIFAVALGTPVISLSGNPFGAVTNLELLVRPALADMTGNDRLNPRRTTGRMADSFPKKSMGIRYIRGIFSGGTVTLPKGLHASGVLSSMQGCNCLIEIEAGNTGLYPGDEVKVVLLD